MVGAVTAALTPWLAFVMVGLGGAVMCGLELVAWDRMERGRNRPPGTDPENDSGSRDVDQAPGVAMTRAPRVLVVGDNVIVGEALAKVLAGAGFLASFSGPDSEYLEAAVSANPDIALVDADLVVDEALGVLQRAGIPLVVMGDRDDELSIDLDSSGVFAVVPQNVRLGDLFAILSRWGEERGRCSGDPSPDYPELTAVTEVSEGPKAAADPKLIQGSGSQGAELRRDRLDAFAVLTPRERSVLGELMEGHNAETIARENWVSVSTVRSQIRSILQKLGVNSQLAAVALARHAGWIPDADPGASFADGTAANASVRSSPLPGARASA